VSVSLQAGKRYYVEALHKENMNGDNLAVAWQTPTNASITVIPGAVLSPFSTTTVNQKPTASITSPANGASFLAPASIVITASATDSDGKVSKVEFFNGSIKLGEDLTSPYSFTWGNIATGSYSLTAKATDDLGASTFTNVSVSTTPTTTPVCTASGSILREYWGNITGSTVATIPLSTTPNATMQLTSFEAPTNVADSYGQRIRGYICAPASGNYTFYIASDNESELWLSTTDNPANKAKIASVANGGSAWTNSREWTKYPGQKSVSVSLQAGKRYYVEALHKENMNGDNLAVAWQTPTNATITVIPGAVLSPFVPSNAARIASIDQLQQPGLSIFPNPLSGEKLGMEISGMEKNQPMKLSLYNSLGALLFSQVLLTDENGGASRELHIDAKLFSGIYMLKVECKSISIVKRVVISR
jgi:hypothetical protein